MNRVLKEAAAARLSRRGLLGGACLIAGLSALPAGPAAARAAPYPYETFFQPDRTRTACLSPSGRRIAVLEQIGTEAAPHGVIDLIEADDPEGQRRRISLGPIEAEDMVWGNDDRLLVRLTVEDETEARTLPGSNRKVQGVKYTSRRIVSVGATTGDVVVLFQDQRQRLRNTLDMGRIVDLLPNEPDHVLMAAWERDGVLGLHRVDIRTGSAERIERGNSGTTGWWTQNGVAVLRRDINSRGSLETYLARAPGETEWKIARRAPVKLADFHWVAETDKPGIVLVRARTEGEDTLAVREMDLATLRVGPAMNARPGRDAMFGLKDSAGRYLGAAYYGARLEYEFAESGLAPHHRALNRFFEDDCDVAFTDIDTARNRFIAQVTGPREPGAWYFYDKTAQAVVNLGATRVLDLDRLGATETLQIPARDGTNIEAYLTGPVGGRPGPLVVMPHGGPEARDLRTWNAQVQALTAQGWWVVQPNFRGSGGYGHAFAKAGWTHWGDRMQEDVEDAVAHVIALRGLDAKRVAIMGTSYGGYAALMGAVRRPELYKAAISICGDSDLVELLENEGRDDDTPGQPVLGYWANQIGDLATDRAAIEAASPRRRVAEIACPVLLVHGVEDQTVPVTQSRRMRDALRGAGKTVELIEVEDAGHGDWKDSKEQELVGRYVTLLRQAFA